MLLNSLSLTFPSPKEGLHHDKTRRDPALQNLVLKIPVHLPETTLSNSPRKRNPLVSRWFARVMIGFDCPLEQVYHDQTEDEAQCNCRNCSSSEASGLQENHVDYWRAPTVWYQFPQWSSRASSETDPDHDWKCVCEERSYCYAARGNTSTRRM